MKYMLIIGGEEGGWDDVTPEQMQESMGRWSQLERDMDAAGVLIAGEGLQESATATTVKIQDDGERVVTDGPFAETKEQLGGYHLVECRDLDEALALAGRIPTLRVGGVIEVRPVMPVSER